MPSHKRQPPAKRARSASKRPPARPEDTSARSSKVLDKLLSYLPPRHRERARDLLTLIRMDRPIGALLLLWPTWWALWIAADGWPSIKLFVIFTIGVFAMRSAGCAMNDFADRKLDPKVKRTAGRPLAAGRVSPTDAIVVCAALLLISFLLVLLTNPLTVKLSVVGAALALAYPFSKRVTHLAQVVLGAAFGWGIPMAFAATTNTLPPEAWLLFLANVLFSVIYDTEYAMVDREDDLKAGSKSTAILFGDADVPILAVLVATFLLAMALAGTRVGLAWPYWPAWLIAAGLLLRQLWTIRDRSREHCFAAFRNNNWVGGVLWLGIAIALALPAAH